MLTSKRTLASRLQFRAARCCRLLIGTLLLASAAAALAAEAPRSVATTHLVGTVLDASGKPAAGALVGVTGSNDALLVVQRTGKPLEAKVGADGRFDLPLPSELGTVTVVARLPGSLAATSQPIALRGARHELAPLKLGVGLKLTGRIVDEQRRPIMGAVVQATLALRSDTLSLKSVTARGKTNREGNFEIAGLDSGSFTITAFSNTHALWTKEWHRIDLKPASRRLDITLRRGEFLSGTVIEATGQPLAGAVIADSNEDSTITTTSDALGRFRLGPLAANESREIHARLAGYTPLTQRLAPPRSDVTLVLARRATLRGRVFDAATNRPVTGFQVSVHHHRRMIRGDSGVEPRTFNSGDGKFELANVYAGSWTITVLAPGYVPWEQADFEFQGGAAHPLAVALTKGTSLRGRVIDKASGKALPGVRVSYGFGGISFPDPNGRSDPPPAISDAAGAFMLDGLPAGTVTLRTRMKGYLSANEQVDVQTQNFVELALPRVAVLRGQVVGADGAPQQATVGLKQPNSSSASGTDAQGRFDLSLLPGSYQLDARTDTARSEVSEVTLEEGQVLDVTLRVTPAASVRGRLSGVPTGELDTIEIRPETGFAAEHFRARKPSRWGTASVIDSNGTYRAEGLAGGATVVAAVSPSRTILKKIDVPERSEVTLDFDFADVRVSGRVTRNGRPVAGIEIHADPLEGQAVAAVGNTSASGEYALCELASGAYLISLGQLRISDSTTLSNFSPVRVEVVDGMVQNFELAPFDIAGRVVDAATGRAIAGVVVQLASLNKDAKDVFSRLLAVGYGPVSNARGEFLIPQLNAGEYQLTLYGRGYDLAEQRIVLADTVKDLAITMQPTAGVRLRVRDADDGPVSEIRVNVQSGTAPPFTLIVPLDSYGVGRLPPALAGRTLRVGTQVIEKWSGAPLDIKLPLPARR